MHTTRNVKIDKRVADIHVVRKVGDGLIAFQNVGLEKPILHKA